MNVLFFNLLLSTFLTVFMFIISKENFIGFLESSHDISSTTSTIETFNPNSEANAFRTRNHDTTVIRHTKSINSLKSSSSTALVPTDDLDGGVPGSGISSNSNIILIVGGVIGLFLGILVRQMCVKLLMIRKRGNEREYPERESEKVEEDTYQEINDNMMVSSFKRKL